ncbi:hypothetical protein [Rhodopirellula sp. MGV]|uniref:hypothetical protein n=1 Tax=Rhodopirellula sp. MGV TaxID=2023130 RepID=UPI000B97B402|nr:hypothetical protein [Rhodopirellula sp. MGV]OYP37696.1 hypothetical protein CGZ80_04215 [Rhodopirellula sp. MGV]PNY37134.1 hypothetical protein C2E31_09070 [Rhodopirellula baltica]
MKATAQKLWNDEAGFVVSIELVLISTICVIGLLTGLTAVRDGVISELSDTAGAVQDLNQSYSYNGVTGHASSTSGSNFIDATDFCDDAEDISGQADNCITFDGLPEDEA